MRTCHPRAHARMARAPAAVEPVPSMRAPSAFVSISAMKLTDPWFWVSNSDASVAERIRARRRRWSGARPTTAPPTTRTPSATSASRSAEAARRSGEPGSRFASIASAVGRVT